MPRKHEIINALENGNISFFVFSQQKKKKNSIQHDFWVPNNFSQDIPPI